MFCIVKGDGPGFEWNKVYEIHSVIKSHLNDGLISIFARNHIFGNALKTVQNTKFKSSRICFLLLFAFAQISTFAYEEPRDTIILDGEVIYIRKQEVSTNIDSLQKESFRDITSAPVFKRKYLAFLAGAELSRVQADTRIDSMHTLNSFLGEKMKYVVNPVLTLQGTMMFTDQIGIYAGIGLNRMKADVKVIDEGSLAPDSSRYKFENRNGTLWQYYNYPVGIGFETDTTQVNVITNTISFYTLDIPLGGRFFLASPDNRKKVDVFMDLGVNLRWVMKPPVVHSNAATLLNENGQYYQVSESRFDTRSLYALAQFKLGALFHISETWLVESQIQINFPPVVLNNNEDYAIRFSNYNISIGLSHLFDGR